jgi:hypothetical protein
LAEKLKIKAVLSAPRLGFTDSFISIVRMCGELQIPLTKVGGGSWGQGMTRLFDAHVNDGTDVILAIDYDTWFLPGHVIMLHQLLKKYPDADAIVPIQVKRCSEDTLFAPCTEKVTIDDMRAPLVPIVVGHFGLTMIRTSAIRKLSKPWFLDKTDQEGDWGDGRTDADIYFWNKFIESGAKAYLATTVFVGHCQLVCTIPDVVEHKYKPIHVMMNDLEKMNVPIHCVPDIRRYKNGDNIA